MQSTQIIAINEGFFIYTFPMAIVYYRVKNREENFCFIISLLVLRVDLQDL